MRKERDNAQVKALLDKLVAVANDPTQNIMPITIELVAAGATMGDIVEKLKVLWGTYRETAGLLMLSRPVDAPARRL